MQNVVILGVSLSERKHIATMFQSFFHTSPLGAWLYQYASYRYMAEQISHVITDAEAAYIGIHA
jgi:hypothetical protein